MSSRRLRLRSSAATRRPSSPLSTELSRRRRHRRHRRHRRPQPSSHAGADAARRSGPGEDSREQIRFLTPQTSYGHAATLGVREREAGRAGRGRSCKVTPRPPGTGSVTGQPRRRLATSSDIQSATQHATDRHEAAHFATSATGQSVISSPAAPFYIEPVRYGHHRSLFAVDCTLAMPCNRWLHSPN